MPIEPSETHAKEEAQQLVERLSALKTEWPSEPSLRSLSPQTIDALMRRFAEIESRTLPILRMSRGFIFLLSLGVTALVGAVPEVPWQIKLMFTASILAPALGSLYFLGRYLDRAPLEKWNYTIYALTQTEDVRVLETLILATRYKWCKHPEVINAINRLLEQVTEADAGLLSDRAQQRLWTIGIAWQTHSVAYDPQMAIRVLRALAAVGNRATYRRFGRFAYRSEHFIGERYAIATAHQLLPVMEARFQRQAVPATLLRASDVPTSAPDTLLRPVHASTTEPTAHLLRASPSEPPHTDA